MSSLRASQQKLIFCGRAQTLKKIKIRVNKAIFGGLLLEMFDSLFVCTVDVDKGYSAAHSLQRHSAISIHAKYPKHEEFKI